MNNGSKRLWNNDKWQPSRGNALHPKKRACVTHFRCYSSSKKLLSHETDPLEQNLSYLSSLLTGCEGVAMPSWSSIWQAESPRPLRLWCSAINDSKCFLRCLSSSRKIWWRRISDQSCHFKARTETISGCGLVSKCKVCSIHHKSWFK